VGDVVLAEVLARVYGGVSKTLDLGAVTGEDMGMPANQDNAEPNTFVQMTIRIPTHLWRGLKAVATEENWSLNSTLMRAVRRWLRERGVDVKHGGLVSKPHEELEE